MDKGGKRPRKTRIRIKINDKNNDKTSHNDAVRMGPSSSIHENPVTLPKTLAVTATVPLPNEGL